MKVLYWTERFWPYIGGIEILSLQLISALQARGYEFIVVTSHSNLDLLDEEVYDGIPIRRFHFLTSLTNRDLKQLIAARQKLTKLKQTFKPDLINIHFSGPSSYFHLQTAAIHSAPTLITVHSLPPNTSEDSRLFIQTLHSANWVNTVSKWSLDYIRQLPSEITHCSSVIYNGIEMSLLPPEPLPFNPPRLLCLGRLVDWKGFDLALVAFASLVKRYPKVRLIVAGDGPERPKLERLASELGMGNAVEFTGWINPERVPEVINTATIVIVPSRDSGGETLPVVAIQGSQMARPVVATCIAGLPEIVIHGETGLLIEQGDNVALTEAIIYLLENPKLATIMGQAGRNRAQKVFSLKNYVDAYDNLYKKIIKDFDKCCVI